MTSKTPPTPPLPPSHPLAAELASLRTQVGQYRAAAHQAAIDVQGVRLELELAREQVARLKVAKGALSAEVDVLRKTPDPPTTPPPSTALAELSLAHRRLSAKLDFTEQQLSAVSLELAAARQELVRAQREREGERAALTELRRVEEDREEEVAWQKSERKRVEEQKRLCDLALAEYAALVSRLDPNAVPPPVPRSRDTILQRTPHLGDDKGGKDGSDQDVKEAKDTKDSNGDNATKSDSRPSSPVKSSSRSASPTKSTRTVSSDAVATSSDAISNLLIGQRGVHRLFREFTSALAARDKEVHGLQARTEELESSLGVLREQLEAETAALVDAQAERDRVLRDDASAAKVVERYMTFSQRSHELVHSHLDQLRARAAATQSSLRSDATSLRRRAAGEATRAARLRAAAEEMAGELGKEAAGRRREVALRLQMIAAEEVRARRADAWLDRARRLRDPESGEPDRVVLSTLVDEAGELLAPSEPMGAPAKASRLGRFLRRKNSVAAIPAPPTASPEDESLARIFLAEQLVQHLVTDLQIETERRIDLEQQRVAWLAKEAEDGVAASSSTDHGIMFDFDDEGEDAESGTKDGDGSVAEEKKEEEQKVGEEEEKANGKKESGDKEDAAVNGEKQSDTEQTTREGETAKEADPAEPPSPTPSSPPPPPQLDELNALFEPLDTRWKPLQKSLHDQAVVLEALRSGVPDAPAGKRAALRALALRPRARDDLIALLDGLYEVIEDARVDVEIAVADEERVFHGFAALLGVGANGVVQAASVLRDAQTYVASRIEDDTTHTRLDARVADVEHDLALIKRTQHEQEGMGIDPEPASPTSPGTAPPRRRKSVWATLPLRAISTTATARGAPVTPLALTTAMAEHPDDDDDDRTDTPRSAVSLFSTVGRSLSSGVVGAASGVAGAPRRVSDFAGGLYRPSRKGSTPATPNEERRPLVERHEDDVE